MCGIAGSVSLSNNSIIELKGVRMMTDALAHRGPDGEGHWMNHQRTVALGHRRLSIIDLSHAGDQPMHYLDRYVIVFNGEIYNYLELREQCIKKGYKFASHSDTEVIMALYDWKGAQCLTLMDGMFALAIWDRQMNELFCARDRFGEKPFYYAIADDGMFLFASEMKAFWAAGLPRKVDQIMVYNYLANSLVEDPADQTTTFFSNIKKLAPAHYLIIKPQVKSISQIRYWNINRDNQNRDIGVEEAREKFRDLFFTSVNRRLRSDVPVGSSLSGGLDSSLVVCTIDHLNEGRSIIQKTFSAQFPGSRKDESIYQQMVIGRCQTDAHFVQPSGTSMLANLQKIMFHQEEPFVHASICAQYEVFKLAKENKVTVLLDGQGADEILAGYHQFYNPYLKGLRQKSRVQFKEEKLAYLRLHADNRINYNQSSSWKTYLKNLLPSYLQKELKQRIGDEALLDRGFINNYGEQRSKKMEFTNLKEALYYETMYSGLETLLRYADRNSMANSREVRLPFLSHELVEFIFSLPDEFKIKEGWTKWIMRTTFDDLVPQEIIWRKDKIGYEPPQDEWMRQAVFQDALIQAIECLSDQKILKDKVDTDYNNSYFLWRIFMTANTLFK